MNGAFSYHSPIGTIVIKCDGAGLTALNFGGEGGAIPHDSPSAVKQAEKWLDEYFSGREPRFTLPLSLSGTEFEMSVWEILLKIPYGRVVSYGQLARILAARRKIKRMAAQAVGRAVGKNPVAIIVPCHRVVGSDFSLTGYAGGLDKKEALLNIERADFNEFYNLTED